MAKPDKPLLSLGARGTISNSLTFQKRGKGHFAREKPIPTDPKSPAQLAQRQIYKDAVSAWHALTPEEKEAWRGVCRGLTAYQCFIQAKIRELLLPTPPEDITIGQEAIDRDAFFSATYTLIANVAADGTGKITEIQLWAVTSLLGVEVATFYRAPPPNFWTRDTQTIGAVGAGYQTFPVDLDVVEGDFLGIYFSEGQIERSWEGYEGIFSSPGDRIPCIDHFFTPWAGDAISLHGTGKTS